MDRLLKDTMTTGQTTPLGPLGQCPDAETLAAWADGTIYGAEADRLEAHLADCQRCQAVLAAFSATEPADATVPVTDAAPEAATGAQTVLPFRPRPSPLRWAVPLIAGTAAASLILYLAWPKPPAIETTIARVEPSAPPITSPPQPAELNARMKTPSIGPAPKQAQVGSPRGTPPPNAETIAAKPAVPEPLQTRVTGSGQVVSPAPTVVLTPTPAVAAPAPVTARATSDLVTAPLPVSQSASGNFTQALQRADRTDLSFIMNLPDGGVEFGPVAPSDPVTNVTLTPARQGVAPRSPLRNIRWHVLVSGIVEKTTDGGKTWTRMILDPALKITTGASPSSTVCWLAGKAGAVMRSTDGGAHWTRVTTPDPGDLVSITATDEQHATVSTAAGRRLTTADGGQTWH